VKRALYIWLGLLLLSVGNLAFAAPGEINPSDAVVSETHEVFSFTSLTFDETGSTAIVTYQSCANNGTVCDGPLVLEDYVVTITLTATTCQLQKGAAAPEACDNASYFISNLEADIDDDAKGLKGGCDAAFTAGYGS
jgi:hypothetical protein